MNWLSGSGVQAHSYSAVANVLSEMAWFGVVYLCISVTVSIVLLVTANKLFRLGGPKGMIRIIVLLVLALVGWVVFAVKKLSSNDPSVTAKGEIKKTIKKTSSWLDGLKKAWDDGKKE